MSLNSSMTDIDSLHCRYVANENFQREDSTEKIVPKEEVALKRRLGLFSGVCFIVGIIIGSGIFVSPKGVLRGTESVGLSLVVWALSGLLSLLGALCYAEIGTIIPRNGAEIAYMKEGIGSAHELIGDILAYTYNWASAFILKPASIAIITLTFAQYLLSGIMNDCGPSEGLVKLTAVFALLILININSISVSAANRLHIIFVICKVTTIVIVIIIGIIRMIQGYTANLENGFVGSTRRPLKLALAFYSGLWPYDGWNSLNAVTEELQNPNRNLVLSIIIALPSLIVLYILTNVSYFTVMTKDALLESTAVAITWGQATLGPVVRVLPILISISALGSANGSLFSSARYCMVGAQYGYLPEVFACIHKQRLTPIPTITFQGLIAIAFCLPSNIEQLIDFFSFSAWIFYGLTFTATLICKFTKKNSKRTVNVPIPIIVIIILASIYLVIAPVIADPSFGFLIAFLIIVSGLILYYPFVHRKIEIKAIQKLNRFLIAFFQLNHAQIKL